MKHSKPSLIDKSLLALISYLISPSNSEWKETNHKIEQEYRKNIPEGKVVEALKLWIDSQWAPPEEHARLWQEVLKAIRDLDESEFYRIQAIQQYHDRKHGKVTNVKETPNEDEKQERYSG